MTKPFLMGAETEFAVSGLRGGVTIDADDVYDMLAEAVKKLRAWAPDQHGYRGLYLENGARLYLDYGSHPEHATAECFTPRQVTLYDKAGEHLLSQAARQAMEDRPGVVLRIIKNNIDPLLPDGVTYGSHESYTSWASEEVVGPALMPHLVSRVLYCGSGGLSGHTDGIGYELSQRARHMQVTYSDDTTSFRAIYSNRRRTDIDGGETWTRLHLLGKDSHRAPFGIYLTYATTGLLVEMLNRGMEVGKGLALVEPVEALHAFSRDPWGKTTAVLEDGRRLTAREIQSEYLEQCERALQQGVLPMWAGEAIGHWRETLADLERDPRRLADRLDPYCKLAIYEHELRRARLEWADLRGALATLNELRCEYGQHIIHGVLTDSDTGLDEASRVEFAVAREKAGDLDRLHFATRLQALELNYHETSGLYDRLREAGRMRDVVVTQADIEQASRNPPLGGRAAVRGEWIRANREADWHGDWQYVFQHSTGRCVDLRDPFADVGREVTLVIEKDLGPYDVEVSELLAMPATEPQTA